MRTLLALLFLLLPFLAPAQKADSSAAYRELLELKEAWYTTSLTDSQFVASNSSEYAVLHYYHTGTFPPNTENAFIMARKGFIIGPFENGNAVSIYKKVGTKKTCDSVQVSHILFAYSGSASASPDVTRSKQQAWKSADSLCTLIRDGKVLLENVVEQVTDDPGSKGGNKGNYGWFTHESGFVEPFKRAAFRNKVGETVVVETDFGYHIIQVEAKTKEFDCILAWQISRVLDTCYLMSGEPNVFAPVDYVGGREALSKYVHDHRVEYDSLNVPALDWMNVLVIVTVDVDSTATDVLIMNAWMGEGAEQDLIELLRGAKDWIPAQSCEGPVPHTGFFVIVL